MEPKERPNHRPDHKHMCQIHLIAVAAKPAQDGSWPAAAWCIFFKTLLQAYDYQRHRDFQNSYIQSHLVESQVVRYASEHSNHDAEHRPGQYQSPQFRVSFFAKVDLSGHN